jgi:hypothetical protein
MMSPTALELDPEVNVRAGFGDVARRLREDQCSIAYFGASVTVQKDGYRPRLHELIRHRFGLEHTSILAAVGATGVLPGVFLADNLVTAHRPDLCLVEYATPVPGRRDLAEAEPALDGIIAKLLAVGCQPCLLHVYRRGTNQDRMVTAFENVAERHQIPSIDLVTPLRAAVTEGRLDKHQIFRDGLHTTPEGSQLVAEMADRAFAEITAAGGPGTALRAQAPAPNYRGAGEVTANIAEVSGDARMGRFRLQRPYVRITDGSAVHRCFDETLHGLVLIIGPESGEVEVAARGDAQRSMAFDEGGHYERLGTMMLKRPVPPGVEVTIRQTAAVPDYSISRRPMEPPPERSLKLFSYLVSP